MNLISAGTLGKVLAVIREIAMAGLFGTTATVDAYRAAWTATLAPVHIFTSEALNAAFIPQFAKDRRDDPGSAWSLFNGMGLLLFLLSLVLGGVLYFFSNAWISLFLPGFSGERFDLAVLMLKVMALGIPLYVLSVLLIALEVASGHFRLAALRPVVQNLGVIVAIAMAFWGERPALIAWGFTGTYLLFCLFGFGRLVRRSLLEKDWYRHWDRMAAVAARFWTALKPMALFSAILQGNVLLEKAIASLIGPGAVASIDYARMIPEAVMGLTMAPVGLVSLMVMANLEDEKVRQRCDQIISTALLLLIPLSCFIFVSSREIVGLFYGRGAFGERSMDLTAQALRGMSVGMWAVSLSYVLQKVYNSRLRNKEVLRIGVAGVSVNVIFNLVAYRHLGVLAIGLGFSLGGLCMLLLFIRGIGGVERVKGISLICILAIGPYAIAAFLLGKHIAHSNVALLAQLALSIVFWTGVFLAAPSSREAFRQLAAKLLDLRRRA